MISPRIYEQLEQLVGYNQPYADTTPPLPSFLTGSESGLYMSDFSAFARADYLEDTAPNYVQAQTAAYFAVLEYSNATAYLAGDTARTPIGLWQAVTATTGNAPGFSASQWRFLRYAPNLGGFLAEQRRRAVKTVLQKVFEDKTARGMTRTLVEEKNLFEGIGRPTDLEPNQGRFVGVEIRLSEQEGLKAIIRRLGLQFTAPQNLTLYLYHRSQNQPLRIINCTIAAGFNFSWTDLPDPLEVYANSTTLAPGETYLLGYYQSDIIGGNAVNKSFHGSNACYFWNPCYSCGARYEYDFWKTYSNYVRFAPFYIEPTHLDPGGLLPDLGPGEVNLVRTPGKTYGLNLSLAVECELDNFISRHRSQFGRLVGLQTVCHLMEQAELNARINRQQSVFFDYVVREKEAAAAGMPSIWTDLKTAYNAVSFDFAGFKSPCLPCENRPGVYSSTI